MKKATISQTKNQLSALLTRVRHGETIVIVDRDQPVAMLGPLSQQSRQEKSGRLARLERAGLVRCASGNRIAEILDNAPPKPAKGGDIVAALLAEREDNR